MLTSLKSIVAKPTIALALFVSTCGGGSAGSPLTITSATAVTAPPFASASTSEACQGAPTPAPPSVLYAPAVPQPTTTSDIVGVNIQNTEATTSNQRIATFGQIFKSGQVQASDTLSANINGGQAQVQMDTLATWPDGSVKFASLALQIPSLCPNAQVPVLISKAQPATINGVPITISLATTKPNLTVTLNFTAGNYTGTQTIDLGARLQTLLAANPDFWLRGPLVTQARVDVPLANGQSASTSTLHLTADVSVFADGSAMADVQFNNDLTTVIPQNGRVNPQGPLPALEYSATVNFQGNQVTNTVSQVQYTNWHTIMWSNTPPQYNVQHDIAQLQRAGAILPYDLTTGVNNTLLQSYDQKILQKQGFGLPLAANGVTPYMPGTGGRPDIGFTTQYNTAWLLTQDARAAKVAMAQSDTSGAIPWNYKLATGRWLTPKEYPKVWTDGRGGPHGNTDGIANTASHTVWQPDGAHQPNLNYVPYLMTAGRWNLDRLYAQAGFNLVGSWPGYRCRTTKCNTLLNGKDQVRGQAWGLRELIQAAFVARAGTPEATWLTQTVADNWAYLVAQQADLGAKQGESTGWIPGDYGNKGATAEWQQDFLTGVAVMAALMKDEGARQFITWQQPWLSGRFVGRAMNPYDGCTYNLKVYDATSGSFYNTWAAIETATVAANLSNGTSWRYSDGYYCTLARSALIGALTVMPNDQALNEALSWLEKASAPYTDQASFRKDPTFNIGMPSPGIRSQPARLLGQERLATPNSLPMTQTKQLPPSSQILGNIRRNATGAIEVANPP